MNKQRANFVEENEESGSMFFTCNVAEEFLEDVWFLDSGCSNHMTGNKKLFSKLDESVQSQVKLGDKTKVPVMGKGIISIKTKQGEKKSISDVYFAPGLEHNLLSVGQLIEKGYPVIFQNNKCVIYDRDGSNKVIVEVSMTNNRMFPLKLASGIPQVLKVVLDDESWLWHMRFGHLSFHGLHLLYKKHMVNGLPMMEQKDQVCEGCILGKQHIDSFPVGRSWRAKAPLELVHSDICGPMQTPSIGKCRYFITFIDDFSRRTWVFFLKEKSEAFNFFKQFKAIAEKQSGYFLKVLRTDRGGEFTSHEFQDFCKENGIKRQLTASYTPQQNGVAERKNRTIVEMARSMMKAKSLPNSFWAEAVATSIYLLNRCPTKSVKGMTPQEAWSGRKPSVAHFKVFGCIAYSHVPKEKRQKLDDKSKKCIFVGYSEEIKGYKLYNPVTNKVIISCDVILSLIHI